eukprot:6213587-Pleurochrysis_carterae.AAC.4
MLLITQRCAPSHTAWCLALPLVDHTSHHPAPRRSLTSHHRPGAVRHLSPPGAVRGPYPARRLARSPLHPAPCTAYACTRPRGGKEDVQTQASGRARRPAKLARASLCCAGAKPRHAGLPNSNTAIRAICY